MDDTKRILLRDWDTGIVLKNNNQFSLKKLTLILVLCISCLLPAQKLGLVLSGGGAPGIAHIGIIKALEDNNIPIDYITGTSIGAIVGGMYAMGMTPEQMILVIKSDDFKSWTTGEMELKNYYYYNQAEVKPGILDFRFRIHKDLSIELDPTFLPTNLVSPDQMNYAFIPLCAQANAAAKSDFDSLFVPFRCVASDIYKKEAVVFRRGELGDAIRASTTFPFMFKPIEINNRLLFDGGIFNNFPTDIMRSDFNPDFTIGSVVAFNPPKADRRDVLMQLQNMIVTPTDYSLPQDDGLLFNFDLKSFNTFDFSKVDALVKIGYDSAMSHLDEIKAHIHHQVTPAELTERRNVFKSRFPALKFQHINVLGIDSLQKLYVERGFHSKSNSFDLNHFKESYYKLISDDRISEVIPHANYNTSSGLFDLDLNIELKDQLKMTLGGNISSSTSNQAFLGLTLQKLDEHQQTSYCEAQFGRMYNGLGLGTRIEMPSTNSWYAKLAFVLHKFDHFEGNKLFSTVTRMAFFTQNETYSKFSIGLPLTMNGRMEFGVGCGILSDYYVQDITLANANDNSKYSLGSVFGRIDSRTLNNVMYPTKGFNYSTSLQLIGGEETFISGTDAAKYRPRNRDMWVQYRAKMERYFSLSSCITLGTFGEFNFSTRRLLQNYRATLIQATSFQPTPYSRAVFNGALVANQFGAIGVKPIYNITRQLHIRSEAYLFVPYKTILRATDNSAVYSRPFTTMQFTNETALVFNFKMASASLFFNYFSTAASKWNVGVNIGILLFNPKFAD